MNYRIDIDELYGIKRRKVSRFQMGGSLGRYLEYYTNPNNPTRTYVLFDAARRANLPFMYNVGDGGLFDYTIASDNPNNVPGSIHTNTMNGNWFDPNTTYLEIDPQTGLIMNGQNGDVVFNGQMNPIIEGNYYYHPQLGWFQHPQNTATIESYDKVALANTIRNRLAEWGMENAYNLDDDSAINFGQAVGTSMLEGAGSIVGGEALSALLNTVNKAPWLIQLISRYPRATATAGTIATQVIPGAAEGVSQAVQEFKDPYDDPEVQKRVKEIDRYMAGRDMSGKGGFTFEDFNNLGGEQNIPYMIAWLVKQGYTRIPYEDGNVDVEKEFSYYPWDKNLPEIWPELAGLGFAGEEIWRNNRRKNQRLAREGKPSQGTFWTQPNGKRTTAGKIRYGAGIAAGAIAYYLTRRYLSSQKGKNEKAEKMIDYLTQKGYINVVDSSPYEVGIDQRFNPQIKDTVPGMLDSAATVQDYNTGQVGTAGGNSDSINENANVFKYQQAATVNE